MSIIFWIVILGVGLWLFVQFGFFFLHCLDRWTSRITPRERRRAAARTEAIARVQPPSVREWLLLTGLSLITAAAWVVNRLQSPSR